MKFKIKETYLLLIIVMGLVSLSVYTTYALFTVSTSINDVVSFNATLNTDNNLIEYEMVTLASGEVKMIEININNTYSTSLYYGAWYQIVSPSDTTDIVVGLTDDNTSSGSGALAKTSSIKLIVGLANNSSKTAVINIGTVGSTTSNLNLPTGRNLIPEGFYVETNPNSPDLVQGLIPVSYNETTSKWVKVDSTNTNNSWYNYKEKKWANAVLVTETNRSTYQSATAGTEIAESDILAFYVWIPRYKYKVWNINKVPGTDSYNAQTTGIDIVFENEKESTGTISCTYNFNVEPDSGGVDLSTTTAETCTGANGDYYTHPAFTYGDNQLRGFWIGKFELSSSDPSKSYGGGNSPSLTPRILPNVLSWRHNSIDYLHLALTEMQDSGNIYGLSTDKETNNVNNTYSDMTTNMEWGAVAYLTNSKYGMCTNDSCNEVSINGYYGTKIISSTETSYEYKTGCGPVSSGSLVGDTTCNAYNTEIGMLASTTGNVYGVYDMSGGTEEFVLSNMSSKETYFSPTVTDASQFSASEIRNHLKLDQYAIGVSSYVQNPYSRGKLGDATSEIMLTGVPGYVGEGWYSTKNIFISGTNAPFFSRGSYTQKKESDNSSNSIFAFIWNNGSYESTIYTTRATLFNYYLQ